VPGCPSDLTGTFIDGTLRRVGLAQQAELRKALMTWQPLDLYMSGIETGLRVLPVLLGMFLGAPLLAREFEAGTFRFAWTQGAGRARTTLSTLVPLALSVTVATCALGVLTGWAFRPEESLGLASRWQPGQFEVNGITFPAWTLFSFAFGVFAGALIQRTAPAMAVAAAARSRPRRAELLEARPGRLERRSRAACPDPRRRHDPAGPPPPHLSRPDPWTARPRLPGCVCEGIRMRKYIFMGVPGSGKSSQAAMLAADLDLTHINVGDIFRWNVQSHTKMGAQVRRTMAAGELVGDDLAEMVTGDRLTQHDWNYGFVIDGFPRNVRQAEFFLESYDIDSVIHLELPDSEVRRRVLARRLCSGCGLDYNLIQAAPDVEGKCDVCGGALVTREDDTEEALAVRLADYHEKTDPVLALFRRKEYVIVIDATPDKETVQQITRERLGLPAYRPQP
jgi:adenylate kinase